MRLLERFSQERRLRQQAVEMDALRKQVERQKAGVLKKPKYKNNPKLVPGKLAAIDRQARTTIAEKKRELARLLKDGVSLRVNKSRELGSLPPLGGIEPIDREAQSQDREICITLTI